MVGGALLRRRCILTAMRSRRPIRVTVRLGLRLGLYVGLALVVINGLGPNRVRLTCRVRVIKVLGKTNAS